MKFYKPQKNYDSHFAIGKHQVPCYSVKAMKRMYPEGNVPLYAEATVKEISITDEGEICAESLLIDGEVMVMNTIGRNSPILFRKAGYVRIDDDEILYVKLLKIDTLFITAIGILAAFAATGLISRIAMLVS